MPRLDERPGAGWAILDPAFAEAAFKRFDFDAQARWYFVGNMKGRMLAVLQGEDCNLPLSETGAWVQRLFVSSEFDEPARALVDRSRAVANARVVAAMLMLNPLSQEQKDDLISLPLTPMANTVIAGWPLGAYPYQPVQDRVFPALAKAYLVSHGFCPATVQKPSTSGQRG